MFETIVTSILISSLVCSIGLYWGFSTMNQVINTIAEIYANSIKQLKNTINDVHKTK